MSLPVYQIYDSNVRGKFISFWVLKILERFIEVFKEPSKKGVKIVFGSRVRVICHMFFVENFTALFFELNRFDKKK